MKCEHCGSEPVQNCMDCRDPWNIHKQLGEDTCPICRNLRPQGCPGCKGGENVVVLPIHTSRTGAYWEGMASNATGNAFLSNPYARKTADRLQWFNGWLDANDRAIVVIPSNNPVFNSDGDAVDLRSV